MRRNIFKAALYSTICFLFVASNSLHAQDWARKMFKESVHDFGMVTKPSRPEYRFEIENIYQEDIRITGIFSSCGCTSVSLSKNVLKTREKGYVICKFNSHIVDGPKQATVTVRFGAPFVGEVQLVVKGNAVRGGGIRVSTKQIDFGQVVTGQTSEQVIQLSRQGNSSFKIADVLSTFPHIGVSIREKYRGRDVVAYEVVTRLKTSIPQGYSQGEMFIVAEDNGQRYKIPVKFNAKVVAPVQISPGILTLNSVKPGELVTKKVIVKSDMPFKITDVTCHSRAFRVRADGTMKKIHFVDVSYTGETTPGKKESFLTFMTSLGPAASAKMKAIVNVVGEESTSATSTNNTNNSQANFESN